MSFKWVIVFHAMDYLILLKESAICFPAQHMAELDLIRAVHEGYDVPEVAGEVRKYIMSTTDLDWIEV